MSYWDSFGYEWTKWHDTQNDAIENEKTFTSKTGLRPDDVKGKSVLDAGCGTGRFMRVVLGWECKNVTGLEPSEAYMVADRNTELDWNAVVFNESIETFKEIIGYKYDIVYCIGVLHHTPNSYESFKSIAKLVKPGGSLHIWVYKKMGYWSKISNVYRVITTRLPWWLLRIMCQIAGPWDYVRRIPIIGLYVWLLIPCSTHPKWSMRVLDTFDWYSPKYQSMHTVEDVMTWFYDCGFINVTCGEVPVSVRGVKYG